MFGLRKRKVQERLNKSLANTSLYGDGTVIGLLGPEPKEYIENLHKYNLGSGHVLYEIDEKRFKLANKEVKTENLTKTVLIQGDIFDHIKLNKLNLSGIDLDFCETLRVDFYKYVGIKLIQILEKNTRQDTWLRITSTIGFDSGQEQILNRVAEIIDFIEKQTEWKKTGRQQTFKYCDSRTMVVCQIKLTKGNKQMKKTTTMNTLKTLPKDQQQMVRDLVALDYSTESIGQVFNLSNTSISALKAHKTMRNK